MKDALFTVLEASQSLTTAHLVAEASGERFLRRLDVIRAHWFLSECGPFCLSCDG